jgi:putative DNA primase/helicase
MSEQKISAYDKQAQTVADFFLEGFRNNTSVWTKPWTGLDVIADPYNPTTGKRYRGGNHFSLLAAQMALTMEGKTNGSDCRWATFKQCLSVGATVRKGEKGTLCVSYNEVTDDRRPAKPGEEPNKRLIANAFWVFHASQMDGLPSLPKAPERDFDERIRAGQDLIDKSGAVVIHGGNIAAFDPRNDRILMPDRGSFIDDAAWMSVALHELGHWSGGKGRLEREFSFNRNSPEYAREELRVEMVSFSISSRLALPSHQIDTSLT